MDKPKRGSKRNTLMSLNNEDAKRVLEIYVKRSLSNCDERAKKDSRAKRANVQRSASDYCKHTLSTNHRRVRPVEKLQKDEGVEDEKKDLNVANPECAAPDVAMEGNISTNMEQAKPPKKQSWLKSFFVQIFRKKDDRKDDKPTQHSEKTTADMSSLPLDVETSAEEASANHKTSKKFGLQKGTIKRAFSFKKYSSDDANGSSTLEGHAYKPKRPSHLPLKRINRPSSGRADKNAQCYYNQVTAEIEHIVKESEKPDARKQSIGGESNYDTTDDMDAVIKKIVSILRKQGDEWNSKVNDDPAVTNFFRNISYNSFKQLADVYVDKELKNTLVDATQDDLKFAYSVHLTAQVAGVSMHSVNRIMGFGNQYLQDMFARYSHGKNWDDSANPELLISPD
uniref:Apoptosis facilitator Bcl-2-like protein 14 n=1 Tax=Leptobrachium leishanense TaxID=445787 RepID=A0A8C5LL60_9ANUR